MRFTVADIKTHASLVKCRTAVSAVLYNFVSGIIGDLTDSSSNQLFRLRIEKIAINRTFMIIHIGKQLDADVAITRVYINSEPRDLLFAEGDGVKTPNPPQDHAN